MAIPILKKPEQHWECPNCDQTAVTHEVNPHTRMHTCPGLSYLEAPFVPAGQKCKVEAKVREDYVGSKLGVPRYDEQGRPIMGAEVTREEGNDVFAYAPLVDMKIQYL